MKKSNQTLRPKKRYSTFLGKINVYSAGLLFLLLTSLCGGCKKDLARSQNEFTSLNSVKEILRKQGFNTTDIVDMGDFFLIGGDIGIKKSSLSAIKRRQVYFNLNPFVDSEKQNNITVRINSDVPSDGSNLDWHTAISMAIAQWNGLLSSNIKFTLVNTQTADITIHTQAINDLNLCAFIDDWPTGGSPSQYITINTLYHYHNSTYTNEQKKWVMVHELGHAINLGHTNEYYYYDLTKIGNSPDVDENSVFNCCMAGNTYPDFSHWDKYAISYLYPKLLSFDYNNLSDVDWTVFAKNLSTNEVYNYFGEYFAQATSGALSRQIPYGNYEISFSSNGLTVPYSTSFSINGVTKSVPLSYNGMPVSITFDSVYFSPTPTTPIVLINENISGPTFISPGVNLEMSYHFIYKTYMNTIVDFAFEIKLLPQTNPPNWYAENVIAYISGGMGFKPTSIKTVPFYSNFRSWELKIYPSGSISAKLLTGSTPYYDEQIYFTAMYEL